MEINNGKFYWEPISYDQDCMFCGNIIHCDYIAFVKNKVTKAICYGCAESIGDFVIPTRRPYIHSMTSDKKNVEIMFPDGTWRYYDESEDV